MNGEEARVPSVTDIDDTRAERAAAGDAES